MNTLLILAPAGSDGPLRCLRVDTDGSIRERWQASSHAQTLPAAFRLGIARTVLAVPGIDVRTIWLDLPAQKPLQALAAAHRLLEDQASGTQDSQHIVIAGGDVARPRLVAVVARESVRQWLQRCAAIGVIPDIMVPDHLLLPAPVNPDELQVAAEAERWLVRGAAIAFSAEASLARQVLAPREVIVDADPSRLERMLAEGAVAEPSINLLQFEFAPVSAPVAAPGGKRLALLALAVLLSPAVLVAAQSLRYELAASRLDRESAALAVSTGSAGGVTASGSKAAGLATPDALARSRNALLGAVSRSPGTRLQSLRYTAEAGLGADVVHATPEQLGALSDVLAQSGYTLEVGAGAPEGDQIRTPIRVERQP